MARPYRDLFNKFPNDFIVDRSYWERKREKRVWMGKTTVKWEGAGKKISTKGGNAYSRYIAKRKKAWLENRSENRGGSEYIVWKWVQKKQRGSHPCRLNGMRICPLTSSFLMISSQFLMVSHFLPTPSLKKKNTPPKNKHVAIYSCRKAHWTQ